MVGTLLVIGMIAGFALYQYIKGGLITGFIFLVAGIVGIAAAFGYYELLAGYVKDYGFIGPKAYPLAFFITFMAAFIITKEVANNLLRPEISFGPMVDKAGGVALGALVGYLLAGVILVVIGLTPYKTNWLYGRFEDKISNPPQPSGMLFNPDGFVTGLFGTLSNGSLKGTQSFALVHADYIDQIFLNRHQVSDGVWPIAQDGAVSLIAPGVHATPENLMEAPRQQDQQPQPFTPDPGKTLTLVKLQINSSALTPSDGESELQPKLALGQLRLIVKAKQEAGTSSSGSGEAIYPIGYINAAGQLAIKSLDTMLDDKVLKSETDFAFNIPENTVPILIEFRHNSIEEIKPMAAPAVLPPAEQPAAPPSTEPNTADPNAASPQV
ncbi:MAG: CvpA family protein [Sedimentisphaerales bacterium]|nr:CvpA family protein [Sedimentisphaerales bacterium]